MSCRLYRDHVIMTFPSFDTASSAWAPQANISWSVGRGREFRFVRFPKRVPTEGEAMAYALRLGEEWIDRRLKRGRRAAGARSARVIDVIGALKGSAERADSTQPVVSESPARRPRESLTFKEFKGAVTAAGLTLSDQLLQKSYAALLNVRREEGLSWAAARRKLSASKRHLKGSPSQRARSARLPLTERDWRRVGRN